MQKIPQIVAERLKAGAPVGGHPDANVLTAFAERSLPDRDRAGVLTHLAACSDCREIVALALPATESTQTASVALRPNWITWPAFRWGFAAASIALIVLGAVEFERRQPTHSETVARQVAPVPPSAAEDKSSPQTTSSTLPTAAPHPALIANEKLAKKDIRKALPGNFPGPAPMESRGRSVVGLHALAAAAPAAKQAPPLNAPPPASVSETVEVQARNEVVETESASAQMAQAPGANTPVGQSYSYNTAPLSRAKPADISATQGPVAGALSIRQRWSITPVGGLQRSFDQGQTWQDVDVNAGSIAGGAVGGAIGGPMKSAAKKSSMADAIKATPAPTFFRAVAAAGNEVWAGGTNAALFHSVDGGNHWTRVLPSFSGDVLTGDVLSVEFPDPQHGTVTTSTPEIWITRDGGQSWQKQ